MSGSEEETTTVVTFTKQWMSYFPGETAAFTAEWAQRLVNEGVVDVPVDPQAEAKPAETG